MDVLGRRLADPFDAFWERYGPEVPATVEHIEEGHSSVFGDLGADRSAPDEPAWAALPDDDLAYHVAHELAHLLLRSRTYPVAAPGSDKPSGSQVMRVAGDLQEMIDHEALSEILEPFGFRNDHILDRTARGASRGLSSSPVPEPGTAWFATWAIRYCDLSRDLGPERWAPIKGPVQGQSARRCGLGRAPRRHTGGPRLRLARQGPVGHARGAGGPGDRQAQRPDHRPGRRHLLRAGSGLQPPIGPPSEVGPRPPLPPPRTPGAPS